MSKRRFGIDLIKIWAFVSVIALHQLATINYYKMTFDGSIQMYILPIFQIVFLSCVPLFLMVSGYLLSNRTISASHYKKLLYFFLEVVIIYGLGIIFYDVIIGDKTLFVSFKKFIKLLLAPNYYVGLYTSLYLISPILNKLYISFNRKEQNILIALVVLLISLVKLQNLVPYFTYYSGWPGGSYPILFYLLGLFVKDRQPKQSKKCLLLGIAGVSVIYTLLINVSMSGRTFYYITGHYEGIFTVVMTVLIFCLLYDLEINNKWMQKAIVLLSNSTMAFYLLSTNFTDELSLQFMNLGGSINDDILSIFPKVLYSSLLIIPCAVIIGITNHYAKKILK